MEAKEFKQKKDFYLEWCITIWEFMEKSDLYMACPISIKEQVLKATPKQLAREIKSIYNDTNEMARDFPYIEKKKLNEILREKFGEDLTSIDSRISKRIDRILLRGKLKNHGEFYLAKEWVDHLLWTGMAGDEERAQMLDRLLYEYEQRMAAKREKG